VWFLNSRSLQTSSLFCKNKRSLKHGNTNIKYEKNQYYFHPDHLGSTSYLTDATGEVYQHIEYFAFGQTFIEEHSNSDLNPYLYNGKELDQETGLYYYGVRYYDPVIGRFIGVDPIIEDFPWVTPYNYAENEPIANIDLWGLQKFWTADGKKAFSIGTSNDVILIKQGVDPDYVRKYANIANNNNSLSGNIARVKINSVTSKVGMNESELYTRAFMAFIKRAENYYKDGSPEIYNRKYRKDYQGTFTDYSQHPGGDYDNKGVFHSPAGAYQITQETWDEIVSVMHLEGFYPQNQDIGVLYLFNRRDALGDIKTGNYKNAIKKLRGTWEPFQPGKVPENWLDNVYNEELINELNNNSNLAIPKGELQKYID